AVPLRSIEEKTLGGSLMPEALADSLTRAELLDLVRFLSELGKVGPYSLSKVPIVRRWQVLEPTRPAWDLLWAKGFASLTYDHPELTWSSAYSKVDGVLPLSDVPHFPFKKFQSEELDTFGFIRFQLDADRSCMMKMVMNSARG